MAHKPKELAGMHVAIWINTTQKFAHVSPDSFRSESEFLNTVRTLLEQAGNIQALTNEAPGAMPTSSDVSGPKNY
jgi:hypothetical protein